MLSDWRTMEVQLQAQKIIAKHTIETFSMIHFLVLQYVTGILGIENTFQ